MVTSAGSHDYSRDRKNKSNERENFAIVSEFLFAPHEEMGTSGGYVAMQRGRLYHDTTLAGYVVYLPARWKLKMENWGSFWGQMGHV